MPCRHTATSKIRSVRELHSCRSFGFRGDAVHALATLASRWQEVQEHYLAQPDQAEALLAVGARPRDAALPVPELAAMTVICSLILNLDEVLCRS